MRTLTFTQSDTLLKRLLIKTGMNGTALASIVNEPRALLNAVLNRVKPAPYRTAQALAEFFGLMPKDLFDRRGFALKVSEIKRDDLAEDAAFNVIDLPVYNSAELAKL